MTNGMAPAPPTQPPTPPAQLPVGSRWEEIIYVIITLTLGTIAVVTISGALWLTAHGMNQ